MLAFKLILPLLAQASPTPAIDEEVLEIEDQIAILQEDQLEEIYEIDFQDDDDDLELFSLEDDE